METFLVLWSTWRLHTEIQEVDGVYDHLSKDSLAKWFPPNGEHKENYKCYVELGTTFAKFVQHSRILDAQPVFKEEICKVLKKHKATGQPCLLFAFSIWSRQLSSNKHLIFLKNSHDWISCFLCMDQKFHKKPTRLEILCFNFSNWQITRELWVARETYGTIMYLVGYDSQHPSRISSWPHNARLA